MKITQSRIGDVDSVAMKLLRFQRQGRYAGVSRQNGVPEIFIAASFEREASSDFTRSPAQGDPLDHVSTHVPKGLGPYIGETAWTRAALDAYRIDGLDKVGAANWTWALACYYAEGFNGWGYRDRHNMRSPYLWGATTLQQRGKYVSDGRFDASVMDQQIGVMPMMMRMAELSPALTMPGSWPFPEPFGLVDHVPAAPTTTPLAAFDVKAVQTALNAQGFGPLVVDGSFGRKTSAATRAFEASKGLVADGALDKQTVDALLAA